jgi:hypothetical protein
MQKRNYTASNLFELSSHITNKCCHATKECFYIFYITVHKQLHVSASIGHLQVVGNLKIRHIKRGGVGGEISPYNNIAGSGLLLAYMEAGMPLLIISVPISYEEVYK